MPLPFSCAFCRADVDAQVYNSDFALTIGMLLLPLVLVVWVVLGIKTDS